MAAKPALFLSDLVQDLENIIHHRLDTMHISPSLGIDQVINKPFFQIISTAKHRAFLLFHDFFSEMAQSSKNFYFFFCETKISLSLCRREIPLLSLCFCFLFYFVLFLFFSFLFLGAMCIKLPGGSTHTVQRFCCQVYVEIYIMTFFQQWLFLEKSSVLSVRIGE